MKFSVVCQRGGGYRTLGQFQTLELAQKFADRLVAGNNEAYVLLSGDDTEGAGDGLKGERTSDAVELPSV